MDYANHVTLLLTLIHLPLHVKHVIVFVSHVQCHQQIVPHVLPYLVTKTIPVFNVVQVQYQMVQLHVKIVQQNIAQDVN